MKIKFLGTAAAEGIPALFCDCKVCQKARAYKGKNIRTRSQVVIDEGLLIDFGPDTYMHTLLHGLDLRKIEHVLITHCHEDHLYLEDLAFRAEPFGHLEGRMHVYGNDTLMKMYEDKIKQLGSSEALDKILCVEELQAFIPYKIGAYTVTPLLANHNQNEKCYIYSIECEGKSLLYGNDTGYFPEVTWNYLEGKRFDCISLDCTHAGDAIYNNHMGIPCCLDVKEKLEKMRCINASTKVIITHFSHNHGGIQEELEEAVQGYNIIVAYDGMEEEI